MIEGRWAKEERGMNSEPVVWHCDWDWHCNAYLSLLVQWSRWCTDVSFPGWCISRWRSTRSLWMSSRDVECVLCPTLVILLSRESRDEWRNPRQRERQCFTSRQTFVWSSVLNALIRSSFFAAWPLETFEKTVWVWRTSSMSFSLEKHSSCLRRSAAESVRYSLFLQEMTLLR